MIARPAFALPAARGRSSGLSELNRGRRAGPLKPAGDRQPRSPPVAPHGNPSCLSPFPASLLLILPESIRPPHWPSLTRLLVPVQPSISCPVRRLLLSLNLPLPSLSPSLSSRSCLSPTRLFLPSVAPPALSWPSPGSVVAVAGRPPGDQPRPALASLSRPVPAPGP
ncbi:hypothetical protein NL676_001433 [Syzygium grande]|nr:hypothetical protein NL676_001433 [Syzygium grande]